MWDSATGRQIAILRGHGGGVFTTAFTPEGAEVLNVRADAANVALPPEGRSAALTFRKRYEISGGGLNRVGEVVSELRWARSPSGWVITSERDLTVPQEARRGLRRARAQVTYSRTFASIARGLNGLAT